MAVQSSLLKSQINIKNVSSSVFSLRKGIENSQKSATTIGSVLFKRNKFKRESIARDRILFDRRRETVKRKEQEGIIEASGIGGAFKRTGRVIADSTKGLLGRIMDYIGTVLVGWLLYNLPTIITLAEDLIKRIITITKILGSFVTNTTKILSSFGSLLEDVYGDVSSFNFQFTNTKKSFENAMDDLNDAFSDMSKSFDDGMKLLTTPLGQGPGEQQPAPLNTEYPEQPSGPGAGGGGGSSGRWKPLLDLISSGESPGAQYDAMYPSRNTRKEGRPVSQMTIAQAAKYAGDPGDGRNYAVGRYQFTTLRAQAKAAGLNPDTDIFSPANQDRIAVHILENKRKGKEWLSGKITDEQFSEYLAGEWGAFRSASGYVLPGNTGSIGFDKIKPTLQKVKATPAQTAPAQTAPTPTAPAVTTTVQDQFKGKPGGAAGKITDVFGYSAWRGRNHNGIDIAPAGPGYYVAFKGKGNVIYAQFNAGGYGNLVIIKDGNTHYYFAHLAKIFVKQGSYSGQTIGEIGATGGATGIHLHFEIRINATGPFSGKAIDPRSSINLLAIGKQLTGVSGQPIASPTPAPSQAQISTLPLNIPQQTQSVTPDRTGPTVVVAPQIGSPQSPPMNMASGESPSPPMEATDTLNRFIVQRLLLDLSYT
jgi:murein DD-endopeptidase MepM/ murein hydrolase activator NlpD